jgi:hypothetical protein
MPFDAYFNKYTLTAINYIRPTNFYEVKKYSNLKEFIIKVKSGDFNQGFFMITQKDHRH